MDLLCWTLHISALYLIYVYIVGSAVGLTVSIHGDNVTLACTDSPIIYPSWTGPPEDLLYNYPGSTTLNPALGEKLSRLSFEPNKSMIIRSVIKSDSGTYRCSYRVDGTYMITTHTLSVRVPPQAPEILDTESLGGTRLVVRGTEDQELGLKCTSNGGYPEPLLYWYKGTTLTQPLDTIKTSREDSDGTYTVVATHTFTPGNQDDNVTFVCQSSFSPPQPSEQRVYVQLLLNRKPSQPVIKSYPVVEGVAGKVANCYTSQFRPDDIDMWFQMNGNNVTSNLNVTDYTGQTFSAVASYTGKLRREQNGKPCVCHAAHQTLLSPLTGSGTVEVRFGTLSASLIGNISNIIAESNAKITLTCTSGTSNPKSTIKWYRDGVHLPNQASVTESNGDYNGVVTSQIIEFVPDRSMDGENMYCTVHNNLNDKSPVPSSTKTLDLLYHPTITMESVTEVEEGSTTVLKCKIDSKPKSTVTWYHDEISLPDDGTTIFDSVFEYHIPVTNRTDSGIYKCAAINGYDPSAESETTLLVKYAPDVTVTTTNVTVNDTLAVLKCIPSGKPATYIYSEWQHIWPGYGRVDHPNRLGNDPVLALSALTYEYSGIYICTVSNGVSGSLRPDAGYGTVYLHIETFPVITTPTPVKVYSNIGGTAIAYIEFYSNRPDNEVDCLQNSTHAECNSEIHNGVIKLPVFGTIVPTMGSIARISFDIYNTSQYGMYKVKIGNAIGTSTIDIEIVHAEMSPENQSNTGAIVGGTIAASVLVTVGIVFLAIRLKYLRQRTPESSGTSPVRKPVDREESSLQGNGSGIHLDLDEHKDVYYNIERNVYDDLQETHGETHEYGILDTGKENDTDVQKDKEYENLELHCQTTS